MVARRFRKSPASGAGSGAGAGAGVFWIVFMIGCWNVDVDATKPVGPSEVDGPVEWYPFDDPTLMGRDRSGHRWDGLPVNVTTVSDPKRGVVANFDSSALILVPLVQRDFTVSLWIKTEQQGPDQQAWTSGPRIVDGDVSGARLDFGIGLLADRAAFAVGTTSDPTADAVSTRSQHVLSDGTWHHVALVRSAAGGMCQLFMDGALDAERVAPQGDLALNKVITIGDLGNTSPVSPPLRADLSDVRFYDRALSAAGVSYLATP